MLDFGAKKEEKSCLVFSKGAPTNDFDTDTVKSNKSKGMINMEGRVGLS